MLRSLSGLAATSLAAALAFAPMSADAYTPESGIWWNPNESGTGVVIEVQDNLMVVAAYVGDATGKATWYTATAFLDGNASFEGALDLTEGSQCIGCQWPGLPLVRAGEGGRVRIVFDAQDETKAALTWIPRVTSPSVAQRTIPIERFEFYTRRPEDGATPVGITKMLGEWQWMLDASSGSQPNEFAFFGDVLVFDVFNTYNINGYGQLTVYEGCRAENSIDGGCSNAALNNNPAVGTYVANGNVQCVVLRDKPNFYGLYATRVGTNDARGEATIYARGTSPVNLIPYPIRGFRSASRTFVQEGTGPSKHAHLAGGLSSVMPPHSVDDNTKAWGDMSDDCEPVRRALESLL